MSAYAIRRLRRWTEPVQEDTPSIPYEHRVTVDKRDLLQLLADYDAATKNELTRQLCSYAWGVDIKYHRDNTIREMKITVRDTVTMAPALVDRTVELFREFVERAPGCV